MAKALTSAVGMAARLHSYPVFKNELIGHDGECRRALHVGIPTPGRSENMALTD